MASRFQIAKAFLSGGSDAPRPYLCISPACGPECSGCNCAISDADMRKYAIRYAYLRNDPSVDLSVRRFPGETERGCYMDGPTLDFAIDDALAAKAEAK